MSCEIISNSCFVCLRRLAEGRGVKSSARLRNSGKLVSDAIGSVLGNKSTFSKLCFRCYRLILGIDFHTLELKKLKETLLKLYSERSDVSNAIENTDRSQLLKNFESDRDGIIIHTDVSGKGVKEQGLPSSRISEFTSANDHVYYKNVHERLVEKCVYTNEKYQVECLASENRLQNSPIEDEVQKSRNNELEENFKGITEHECNNLDNSNHKISNGVQENLVKDSTLDRVQNVSRKRRKIAKKLEDYEYYTDNSKIFESRLPNNSEKYFTECDSQTQTPKKNPINCNLCKKDFTSKKKYFSHECLKMKKKANISYTCKGCQSEFVIRRNYIKHIDSCYKNMPVSCHICLIKLPSAAYLPRHLKSFHEGPAVVKKGCLCDQCGRSFSRKEALERHQAQVHGLSHGTHQCPKCGCTFPHTSLLAEHLRAHKGYTCTECKKTFSCMSNLTLHKRAHHQKKALYHCSRCNKRWRFHSSYTYHMRKLHGLAQHKCSKCKLLFSAESALERHKEICVTHRVENNNEPKTNKTEKVRIGSELKGSDKNGKQKARKNSVLTTSLKDRTLSSELVSVAPKAPKKSESVANIKITEDNTEKLQLLPTEITSKSVTVAPPITGTYRDQKGIVESKDTIVFMPPVAELKDNQVVYQVSGQEPPWSSSGEIVLETLDDLSNNDCQYVILVEEDSNDPMRVK